MQTLFTRGSALWKNTLHTTEAEYRRQSAQRPRANMVHCDGDGLCEGSLQVQEALECAEWLLVLMQTLLPAGWDFPPRASIQPLWTEPDLHLKSSPLPGGLQLSEKECQKNSLLWY